MTLMPDLQATLADAALQADRETRRTARRRRIALGTLAGVVGIGGVATAAVSTFWQPSGPELGERTVRIDRTTPPAAQLAALGVFRRPAEPDDRGARALAALRFAPDPLRTNYVRLVATDDGGPGLVLASIASQKFVDAMPRTGKETQTTTNPICLVLRTGAGGGGTCATTSGIKSGRAILGTSTRVYGLVPDGVASVTVTLPDGPETIRADVDDNAFVARISGMQAPKIRWYADDGHEIAIPEPPATDPDVTITCADGSTGKQGGRLQRDLPCTGVDPRGAAAP